MRSTVRALRRLLDEALVRPLTLIVAPAGAGKSVLLAQWAATHPDLAFVWMDLTPADDDPVRFSQRLLQSHGRREPRRRRTRLPGLRARGRLGSPLLEALVTSLAGFPETVIVLDDLHQLSNATLIADLGHLVDTACRPTSTWSCRPGSTLPSPGAATACSAA